MVEIIIKRSGEFKPVLDREDAVADAQPLINVADPLLTEAIDHATHAFARCGNAGAVEGENVDIAAFSLYAHTIEMADGIQVLLSRSCPNPATTALRSMFEAYLQLSFIMKEDYKDRALEWLVCYLHRRLKSYEHFDPDTATGNAFREIVAKGNVHFVPADDNVESTRKTRRALESVLARPVMEEAEQRYLELKKRRSNRRKNTFYELFHQKSLRQLAEDLGVEVYYAVLYRHWSEIAHGGDMNRFLTSSRESGRASFYRLRSPIAFKNVADFTVHFLIMTTRIMLNHFREGENLENWYKETFKPLRERFDGFKVVFRDDD